MSGRPLFHSATAAELTAYTKQLPQGILLYGKQGIGLDTAAYWLASQAKSEAVVILPEYEEKVNLERGRITVDIIRRLYEQTRTKNVRHRSIIISQADTITVEAQHAFLKLLEEPNDNVTFILVCHQPDRLLPTVLSRVQQVHIRRIDAHQSEVLLTSLGVKDDTTRSQLLFIAEGLPGMLTQLAQSPQLLEQEATKLRSARALIQGSAYERLVIVQQLKDSRVNALEIVSYMLRLLKREISTKGAADRETIHLLEQLEIAYSRLEANGNVRLTLAAALLHSMV